MRPRQICATRDDLHLPTWSGRHGRSAADFASVSSEQMPSGEMDNFADMVPPQLPESIHRLAVLCRTAWTSSTSADPANWSTDNPAWGQCAVTALVVQDLVGGRLLRSTTEHGSHYWNLLPDGTHVDLTREQFNGDFVATRVGERDRGYVLSFPETRQRYARLRAAIAAIQDQIAPAGAI